MIYISSYCIKKKKIIDAIKELRGCGITDMELTGGTDYYDHLTEDVMRYKLEHRCNFLIHNYFPPPKKEFILNLASQNDAIFRQSLDFYKNAINFAKQLSLKQYGFHAGFYCDMVIGNDNKFEIVNNNQNKEKSIERFCKGFEILKKIAGDVALYVENNVLSRTNYLANNKNNPFMLTDYEDYVSLKRKMDFRLLFDTGHLKVTAKTLNLNLTDEMNLFWSSSDYIHLNDNDGNGDINSGITANSQLWDFLSKKDISGKTITIEVGDKIEALNSYRLLTQKL